MEISLKHSIKALLFVATVSSCTSRELNYREYSITQCEKDTAIEINNLICRNVSIIVEGSIDSAAIIDFQEHNNENYRKNPSVIQFRLTKGVFSKKERNEIYAQNYVLYYDHQKATKGNLKIKLQLLDVDNVPIKD